MPLDSTPPSPLNPSATSGAGGSPPSPGTAPSGGGGGAGGLQAAMDLGQQVDQAISALAQTFPQGAEEFRQAKQLVMAGMSKALAGLGQTSATPTTTGGQFPGASPSAAPPTGMPTM